MNTTDTTKRDKIINLLNELHENLELNRDNLEIVGHIMPDVAIKWRCYFRIFPRGHSIYEEYTLIEDPKNLGTKREINSWISKAMALTETTISLLNTLDDDQLNSAGISLLPEAKPQIEIKEHLSKYKPTSEIYLLNEIAEECEKASILDCRRACAFYVRKILEISIQKRALIDGVPLKSEEHYIGLKALLGSHKDKLGGLHKELLSRKFLLEETIHDDHNPSFIELRNAADLVFRAIDKLEVFELEIGGR